VNPSEIEVAVDYLRQGWPYVPMPHHQETLFRRVFAYVELEDVLEAIDRFALDRLSTGSAQSRPGPVSFGEKLRRIQREKTIAERAQHAAPEPLPSPKNASGHVAKIYADNPSLGRKKWNVRSW
jgi:hypothetical protein